MRIAHKRHVRLLLRMMAALSLVLICTFFSVRSYRRWRERSGGPGALAALQDGSGGGSHVRGRLREPALSRSSTIESMCKSPLLSTTVILLLDGSQANVGEGGALSLVERASYYGCRVSLAIFVLGAMSDSVAVAIDHLDWPHGKVHVHIVADPVAISGRDGALLSAISSLPKESLAFAGEGAFVIYMGDGPAASAQKDSRVDYFGSALDVMHSLLIDRDGEQRPYLMAKRLAGIVIDGAIEGDAKEASAKRDSKEASARRGVKEATTKGADFYLSSALAAGGSSDGDRVVIFTPWFWTDFAKYIWQARDRVGALSASSAPFGFASAFIKLKPYLVVHRTGQYWAKVAASGAKEGQREEPLTAIAATEYEDALLPSLLTEMRDEYVKLSEADGQRPTCILDDLSSPMASTSRAQGGRYLAYEPQGTFLAQRSSLVSALTISSLLNRTLIVPPLFRRLDDGTILTVPLEHIFQIKVPWAQTVPLAHFPFRRHRIGRNVLFRTNSTSYEDLLHLPAPLAKEQGLGLGEQIILPALLASDTDMLSMFAACTDTVLYFRHFDRIIDAYEDERGKRQSKEVEETLSIHPALEKLAASFGSHVACGVYSRGGGTIPCGGDIKPYKAQGRVYYQNCIANATRISEYVRNKSQEQSIPIEMVYVIEEAPLAKEEPLGDRLEGGLTVRGTSHLVAAIVALCKELRAPPVLARDLGSLVERQLCMGALMFVSHRYSQASDEIVAYRKKANLALGQLG